jgi:hypothetical protein
MFRNVYGSDSWIFQGFIQETGNSIMTFGPQIAIWSLEFFNAKQGDQLLTEVVVNVWNLKSRMDVLFS